MKTLLFFLIAAFLAMSVAGQSSNKNNTDKATYNLQHLKDYETCNIKNLLYELSFLRYSITEKVTFLKSELATKQKLDSIVFVSWDENTSQWANDAKESYTYNKNGNVTIDELSFWDDQTELWEDFIQLRLSYDANGLLAEYIIAINFGVWIDIGKYVPKYNTKGLCTEAMIYSFDTEVNNWVLSGKLVFTYDSKNNLTELLSLSWNITSSEWMNDTKNEYSYETNGNCTLLNEFSWDTLYSKWINTSKTENSFDVNTNLIWNTKSIWDEYSKQWALNEKTEYTYNNAYSNADLIIPIINLNQNEPQGFRHMVTMSKTYSYDGSNWIQDGKNVYKYSTYITNDVAENYNALKIDVYPNPATTGIYIHFDKLQNEKTSLVLYNMFGEKIYEQLDINTQTDTEINLTGQTKGIYILKAVIGNQIYSEKVILR